MQNQMRGAMAATLECWLLFDCSSSGWNGLLAWEHYGGGTARAEKEFCGIGAKQKGRKLWEEKERLLQDGWRCGRAELNSYIFMNKK
jgi:hypothetical protein